MMCCAAPQRGHGMKKKAGADGKREVPGLKDAAGGKMGAKGKDEPTVDLTKQQVYQSSPLIFNTTLAAEGQDEMHFEEGGARVVRGESISLSPVQARGPSPGGSPPTELKKVRSAKRPGPPGGAGNRYRTAACTRGVDRLISGTHFAEFTIVKASGNLTLGVAQENYSPNRTVPPGTARPKGEECWGLSTRSGSLTFRGKVSDWEGKCPIVEGDRVGMLVDLAKGCIAIFRNDKLLGLMVKAGLTGPLCWMAELSARGDSVRILRQSPIAYANSVKEHLAKKIAPQRQAPKTEAPKRAAPKTAAPKTVAPKRAAPQRAAPQRAAPQRAAPQRAAPTKK